MSNTQQHVGAQLGAVSADTHATIEQLGRCNPNDLLAVIAAPDETCMVTGCTEKPDAIAIGLNASGSVGISPMCEAHAKAQTLPTGAYVIDAYESGTVITAAIRETIARLLDEGRFPFLVRNPDSPDRCALFFENGDGKAGYVPLLVPFEPEDKWVAPAGSLQVVIDALLEGKSLSMMLAGGDARLAMADVGIADFVEVPTLQTVLDKLTEPGVHRVNVLHDPGCPRLSGGECNCDADLEVQS